MCDGKEITENDILFNAARGNDFFISEEKTLKNYSNYIVEHFMQKYNNDIPKVAQILDIGKSTIYKMMQNGDIVIND
jgi:transcriptional regulator with PAS, ATPase and Fis domain